MRILSINWMASIAFSLVVAGGTTASSQDLSLQSELTPSGAVWFDRDGAVLPIRSDHEAEQFLERARIVSRKTLGRGINKAQRLDLEWNGIAARAIFRTVDKRSRDFRLNGKTYRDFHDSHIYECAAYRLSRLLGISHVPPCVTREIDGTAGTVQLWVEAAMTENEHRNTPDRGLIAEARWPRPFSVMRVFDAIIDNFDRNSGNVLVDAHERIWFIDHTRSFRLYTDADVSKILKCDEDFYERIRSIDRDALQEVLGAHLERGRIDALERRRRQVVGHLDKLIARRGRAAVLFSTPRQTADARSEP